jgi:hypothetical protein
MEVQIMKIWSEVAGFVGGKFERVAPFEPRSFKRRRFEQPSLGNLQSP